MLSTAPFFALLVLLAILTVGMAITAFPGSHPQMKPTQVAQRQVGVAPKGWFQEAEKEFHR